MNLSQAETCADERIFSKLRESSFFMAYREAFEAATGLPLDLVPAEGDSCAGRLPGGNAFCDLVNRRGAGCGPCREAGRRLRRTVETGPTTLTCFAGLRESGVPVRSGGRLFALLVTGAVDTSPAGEVPSREIGEGIAGIASDEEERRLLEEARVACRSMTLNQYRGGITLLATFALQLSDLLNQLLIEESHAEPEVVVKAKRYVNANLEDKISLASVALHVGVSPYYFCKVFKQSVGMTLTEYMNRRRVERAKRRLLDPRARVTEVAFDVGFQSISQFNRSFLKYAGESPSRYRERKAAQTGTILAAA